MNGELGEPIGRIGIEHTERAPKVQPVADALNEKVREVGNDIAEEVNAEPVEAT